jgi:hypothetical protein
MELSGKMHPKLVAPPSDKSIVNVEQSQMGDAWSHRISLTDSGLQNKERIRNNLNKETGVFR